MILLNMNSSVFNKKWPLWAHGVTAEGCVILIFVKYYYFYFCNWITYNKTRHWRTSSILYAMQYSTMFFCHENIAAISYTLLCILPVFSVLIHAVICASVKAIRGNTTPPTSGEELSFQWRVERQLFLCSVHQVSC